MSEEKSRLRIHTQIMPEESVHQERPFVRWRSIPHPKNRKSEKLTHTDRLLRNSALACALLLAILAMGNINQPWALRASDTIERALTMHIDLDESIGQLSFVRNLMPESALVFLNLSGSAELAIPVAGELTHAYSDAQPWLMFSCPDDSDVVAAADGTVTAVSVLPNDAVGVLVDHGGGRESVYAYLTYADVAPGDAVLRGQVLGSADETLYFELRENEVSINPSAEMGL